MFLYVYQDHTSFQPVCDKILEGIINDKSTIKRLPETKTSFPKSSTDQVDLAQALCNLTEKSNIILPPLSILAQQNKLPSLIKSIHQIKTNSKTKQIFVWATVKNIHDKKVIPFVEYLADIVVTLRDEKTLTILTKKSSGSVTKKVSNCA